MQQDPALTMADMFLRFVVIQAIGPVVWAPLILLVAYLHAKWSKGR